MISAELGPGALLTLVPISALAGVATLVAFLRWTDRDALRRTVNRMLALVMELGLFIEEPLLVLRAQGGLLRENLRLLVLLVRPAMITAIAFFLMWPHLDALYGNAALRTGEPAVVTVQLAGSASEARIALIPPPSIAVETPGLRVLPENQISWRIRPLAAVSGSLDFVAPGGAVTKRIAAGPGLHYLSPLRTSSWIRFLLHPVEPPLSSPEVSSIAITYPPASILDVHWIMWFVAVASVSALLASFVRPG